VPEQLLLQQLLQQQQLRLLLHLLRLLHKRPLMLLQLLLEHCFHLQWLQP
jgi:hypothetical protein